MISEMYIKGTQVNYYFICKTKLWLFSHNITMEHESDAVKLGKLIHREVFKRDEKEVQIGPIAIDVVRVGNILEIREIKKSRKMEDSYIYQTLYYLYFLKKFGIDARAVISFPKRRENIEIELSREDETKIKEILMDIEKIINSPMPKPEYRKICRKCAYFEFCFA
ncbi:CRISPR-associated exonuclease, Cas4 family [Archaeoglobus sulfaticallidus PM70-1]|uniref:CRISPR-associated exonuclease Cas4 n=1 Tax=Archaeoglobus sulfaticallidus PM70-1 TaxID=387631 RepID=N0BL25_9EURY|nr:CRISPR-associated protein Cas4 [Archaeoglobus sulfaticallidus]AGK61241.1 CRISPR-associated exonuclease, Cas4 family [Archaeoglobus sulfaticallidus PM70-1]